VAEAEGLVFLSARSSDYGHAEVVYRFLVERGVEVFFSRESLPELGSSDYRNEIDRALDRAQHMIVVASSAENVVAPWVEAEWGFFINEKRSGRKRGNLLTVTVGEMSPGSLPPSLRYYEVIPLEDRFLGKLLGYLRAGESSSREIPSRSTSTAAPQPPAFRETATFGELAPSVCIAAHPSHPIVALGGLDGAVRIWDLETRTRKALLGSKLYWAMRHESLVKSIAFDASGSYVATGHHQGVAHVWDVEEEEEFGGMRHRHGGVEAVAFSPDGKTLATGGEDACVQLWELSSLRKGDTRPGLLRLAASVVSLTYLDVRGWLLSGQVDAQKGRSVLQIHDCTKSRELATLYVPELFSALAVSSDRKLLAAGKSDGTLGVFDLAAAVGDLAEPAQPSDLRPLRSLAGHRKEVTSVAFLPGGARAVSAAMEPKVILWDLDSGERTTTFRGARGEVFASVAVLRGGATIAACLADGRIRLWEAV
jgi:hypothetical protein